MYDPDYIVVRQISELTSNVTGAMLLNTAELISSSHKLVEANDLNQRAALCEQLENYSSAALLYEEALLIFEELLGAEHMTTALITRNLARVHRAQGNVAEASLLEDHVANILSSAKNSDEIRQPFGGSSGFFELMGSDYTASDASDAPGGVSSL